MNVTRQYDYASRPNGYTISLSQDELDALFDVLREARTALRDVGSLPAEALAAFADDLINEITNPKDP